MSRQKFNILSFSGYTRVLHLGWVATLLFMQEPDGPIAEIMTDDTMQMIDVT